MPGTSSFRKKLAKEANAQVMNELKNAADAKAYHVKVETENAQKAAGCSMERM